MNSVREEVLFRSSGSVLEPLSSNSATRAANFATIEVIRSGLQYTTRVFEANGNIFGVHTGIPDSLGLSGKQFLLKLKLHSSDCTESYTVHILNDGEASNLIQLVVALTQTQLGSPVVPALVQQQQLLNFNYGNPNPGPSPLSIRRQQQLNFQYGNSILGPNPFCIQQQQSTPSPISTPANVFPSFIPGATSQQIQYANQDRSTSGQKRTWFPPLPPREKTPPRPLLPPPVNNAAAPHPRVNLNVHPKRPRDPRASSSTHQKRPRDQGRAAKKTQLNEDLEPSASKQVRSIEQPQLQATSRPTLLSCPYCSILLDQGRYILHLDSDHREQANKDRMLFYCGSCPRIYLTPIDQMLHSRILHVKFKCLYCDYHQEYYRKYCRDSESKQREYAALKTHILQVHHDKLDRLNRTLSVSQQNRGKTSHPNYQAWVDANSRHRQPEMVSPSNRQGTRSDEVQNQKSDRDKGANCHRENYQPPKSKVVGNQERTDRFRSATNQPSCHRPIATEHQKPSNNQAKSSHSAPVVTTSVGTTVGRPHKGPEGNEVRLKSSSPEVIAVSSSTDVSQIRRKAITGKHLGGRIAKDKNSKPLQSRTTEKKGQEIPVVVVDAEPEHSTPHSVNVSAGGKTRKSRRSVGFSAREPRQEPERRHSSSSPEIILVSSTTGVSEKGRSEKTVMGNSHANSVRTSMVSPSQVQQQSSSKEKPVPRNLQKRQPRKKDSVRTGSHSEGEPQRRSGSKNDPSSNSGRCSKPSSSDESDSSTDTKSESSRDSDRHCDSEHDNSDPQSQTCTESDPELDTSTPPEILSPGTSGNSPVTNSKKKKIKKRRQRIRIMSPTPSPERPPLPTNLCQILTTTPPDSTRVSKGPLFGSIECECGTWEACYSDLIRHVQNRHPKRIFACDHRSCRLKFITGDELQVHQASEHSDENVCPFCTLPLAISNQSSFRTQLSTHLMNVHEQTKSFVIPLDFIIFGFGHHSEYLQRISRPRTVSEVPSTCEDCDSSFSSALYLKLHQKFRLGSDCLNCTKCDSVFQAKFCRKSANWWIDWANHFESHPDSKEKIHRCHCGIVSLTELEIQIHKTLHRDNLTHCCIKGCGWVLKSKYYVDKFARRLVLTEHYQQFHKEALIQKMVQPPSILLQSYTLTRSDALVDKINKDEWHKCSFCNKGFQSQLYMKLHMKISHEGTGKTKPCKECDPVFENLGISPLKSWQSWLHHIKIHEDNCRKQLCFRCNTCDQLFLTEDERLLHSIVHSCAGEYACPCCDEWSMAEINWETFTSHVLDTHEQELELVLPLRLVLGLGHHNFSLEKEHKNPETAPCSDCRLRMPVDKKDVVKMHMDYAHSKSAHLCLHCGEHTVTRNKLMGHLRKCKKLARSQDTSFCLHQCFVCEETFLTETYRDRHCFLAHHQVRCFLCYERIKSSPNASRHVIEAQYAKHLLEDHWKAPLIPLLERMIKVDAIPLDGSEAHHEPSSMTRDDNATINGDSLAEDSRMDGHTSAPGSPEPLLLKPALVKVTPAPVLLMTLDDDSSEDEEPSTSGTAVTVTEMKPNVQMLTVTEYEGKHVPGDVKPHVFLKPKPVPVDEREPPEQKIELIEYESVPKAEPSDSDSDETILNGNCRKRVAQDSDSVDPVSNTSSTRAAVDYDSDSTVINRRNPPNKPDDSDSDDTVINRRNPPNKPDDSDSDDTVINRRNPLNEPDDSDSDDTVINPVRTRGPPPNRVCSDSDDDIVINANETEDIEEIETEPKDARIPVILNEYNLPDGYENLFLHSSKFGPFICYLCRNVCETYNGMRRHWTRKHNLENVTNCCTCKLPLPSEELCQAHEHNVHYYKCSKCDKRFDVESLLRKHEVLRHKSMRKYRCNVRSCLGKYISKSALARHFTKRHPGCLVPAGDFECHVCFKMDMTKDELKDHVKTHEGSLMIFCPSCDDWWISGPEQLVQDFFIFHFIYLHGSEYIRGKLKESFNR